jgi:hypothetical protein
MWNISYSPDKLLHIDGLQDELALRPQEQQPQHSTLPARAAMTAL